MTHTEQNHSIRAFFAIDLNESVKKSVTEITAQLQEKYKQPAIRWSEPDNLHITLQFLPAVRLDDIETMVRNVSTELKSSDVFQLELKELELFPTPHHPRIISLAVGPHESLSLLSESIGKGIVASGYDIEKRPFRGHLTLARLNGLKEVSLDGIGVPLFEKIEVKGVILYQSEGAKEGSMYTPLARIELGRT